ncbi:unnamed protein product [Effrenium voratum]|nr:unnamed protein product [Effrenium voratum]
MRLLPLLWAVSAAAHRPQYAKVSGAETLWQRPEGEVKGILFIAHGCKHQATDVFSEVTDGWKFESCARSNFGRCLALPEEVEMRNYALSRGYVVMAVSGGSGVQSCWYGERDVDKVVEAVAHVRQAENLATAPLLAMGASSGGAFVGLLPAAQDLNLKCIVPEIMDVQSDLNDKVPTLFIHMPRDHRTARGVKENIQDLQDRNVRVTELSAKPRRVTSEFLQKCVTAELAKKLLRSFEEGGVIDSSGYLQEDPRARGWVSAAKELLPEELDSLEPDESCLAELMNVAWAFHEFTAEFAPQIIDFCEGKDITRGLPTDGWQTSLGSMQVEEYGRSGPLAIAIHGMAKSMVTEWDFTAQHLAEEGYHVLVPNFHSNKDTRPGKISADSAAAVLLDLMKLVGSSKISLLMGKSWGGGMASALVNKPELQARGHEVEKMVLVAPASLQPWPASCRAALFWAEDDAVVPIKNAEAQPELLQKLKLFHKERTGGHRILDTYLPAIMEFAEPPALLEVTAEGETKEPAHTRSSLYDHKIILGLVLCVLVAAFLLRKRKNEEPKRSPRPQKLGAAE